MSLNAFRRALIAGGVLVSFMGTAVAAPPELPTLETIYVKAKAARAEEIRLAEEAKRNPTLEAINNYAGGETPLADFKPLIVIMKDSKTDDLQQYRSLVVTAFIKRFRAERIDLPDVRKARRRLALDSLDLMRSSSKDQVGLVCIETLLYAWWKAKIQDLGFKATNKSKTRIQDYKSMKRYLEKGERE